MVADGGHSCTQPVTLTRGPVKNPHMKNCGLPFRQVFGLRGVTRMKYLVGLDYGLSPFRAVPEQCSCSVRSPIPLRDSPGFTPGSLLLKPQYLVISPESDYKIEDNPGKFKPNKSYNFSHYSV